MLCFRILIPVHSDRILSDDFIAQTKKVIKEKNENKIAVKLLLPAAIRNQQDEKLIAERLRLYFKNIHLQIKADASKTNRKGLYFIFIGIVLMTICKKHIERILEKIF